MHTFKSRFCDKFASLMAYGLFIIIVCAAILGLTALRDQLVNKYSEEDMSGSYDKGYDAGFDAGRDLGKSITSDFDYFDAKEEGKSEGYTDGYYWGYEDGYMDGAQGRKYLNPYSLSD